MSARVESTIRVIALDDGRIAIELELKGVELFKRAGATATVMQPLTAEQLADLCTFARGDS